MDKFIRLLSGELIFKTFDEAAEYLKEIGFETVDVCSWEHSVTMQKFGLQVKFTETENEAGEIGYQITINQADNGN